MENMQTWINRHKFELYVLAFLLIMLPSVALYPAAQQGAEGWMWTLLALVVLGNVVAIAIP
jgi:hypothetical protein